jgi:hypothetical protein
MPPCRALLLAALATMAAATGARAEIEFAGYLCSPPDDLKFVLADPATRQTSDVLGIGGSFAGYRVTAFEAKSETLTVEKDGTLQRLRLKNAVPVDAGAARERAAVSPPLPPPAPDLILAGAQRLISSATDAQIKLIREQQIQLARQQDQLWQAAARLRATLPAGHPQRIAAEADLAHGARLMNRTTLQLDRILLLRELRAVADTHPPRAADLQAKLRDLDARIAQATAATEPSSAQAPVAK